MTKLTWEVNINQKPHTIQLDHGYFTGKRKIQVDGLEIVNEKMVFDFGSQHQFTIDSSSFDLVITTNGLTFEHYLLQDGVQITARGKRDRKNKSKRSYLAELEYWKKLAEVSGLNYVPFPNVSGWARHRLFGHIHGYLTVVRFVYANNVGIGISVLVRFATIPNPDKAQKQLKSELKKSIVSGNAYIDRSLVIQNNFASIMLPYHFDKDTPDGVFSKIESFVKVISNYAHPLSSDKCEGAECRFRFGNKLRLAFTNGFPEYLCEDCAERIPQVLRKRMEEHKSKPDKLVEGIVAGLIVMVGGGIIWALVAVIFDRILAVLAAGMFILALKAMDKVGTKRTRTSMVAASILGMLGAALGTYLSFVFFIIKAYPDHVSIEILYVAWQSMWDDKRMLYTSFLFGLLGILPYLWLVWSSQKHQQSSMINPVVEQVDHFQNT